MRQLLYVSNTSRDLDEEALSQIVAASRRNNAALDVSGILFYADGGFLQVLEGEPAVIEQLYRKIATDPRHWNTLVLLDRHAERAFAGWSMGYRKILQKDGEAYRMTREATLDHKLPPDISVMLRTFLQVQDQ